MSSMLDAPPNGAGAASWLAVLGTVAAHALLAALASQVGVHGARELQKLLPITQMVEVALPEPPAPAPPAVPPPVAPPAPPPAVPARVAPPQAIRERAVPPAAEPPPPSAAQAGQVLDAKSEVVDFGDAIVTGSGNAFAGGVTDGAGTSRSAVRDSAARGDARGTGAKPAAPVVDLSRPPQLAGGSQWQCPFPPEADDAGVDHALVTLRVNVAADGRVQSVVTSSDPGNGFGREARRCASSKRWSSGVDREGRPTSAVAVVNVRFDR
jgi:periplasmic protein TonB